MHRRAVWASLHAGVLIALLGLVGWATARPFVFPSLGPSALLLVFQEHKITGSDAQSRRMHAAREVIGGHLCGVVAGLVSYHLLARGVAVSGLEHSFSLDGLRIVASGVLSLVLTVGGMIAGDAVHAPACATTLIVSLGVLSTFLDGLIIMASVLALFGAHCAYLFFYRRYFA